MSKYKFHFDPETLSYIKVKISLKTRIFKNLPKFATAVIFGVVLFIVLSFYVKSPIEKRLEEEKQALLLQYDYLNQKMAEAETSLQEIQKHDDDIYRKIFQARPVPESVRKAGFGGTDRYNKYNGYSFSPTLISTAKRLDILSKQLVVQSKSFDDVIEMVKNKEKMRACVPSIQPIAAKDLTRFGSAFGYRMHPILGYLKMHTGVDLTAPTGTKVYAPGDGVVLRADWAQGYGNCIRINHGYGFQTVYGHLSKMLVRPGQKVNRGDVIGLVGTTGLSTSPHLHYEVRINGQWVNPVNYYYNTMSDDEVKRMINESKTANTHSFEE